MRLYVPSRSRTTSSSVAAGPADGAARTRPATTRARALRIEPLYTTVRGRGRARDLGPRLRRRALRWDARVLRVRLARLPAAPSGRAAPATRGPLRAVRAAPAPRGERLGEAGPDPPPGPGGPPGAPPPGRAPPPGARPPHRPPGAGRGRPRPRAGRGGRP